MKINFTQSILLKSILFTAQSKTHLINVWMGVHCMLSPKILFVCGLVLAPLGLRFETWTHC